MKFNHTLKILFFIVIMSTAENAFPQNQGWSDEDRYEWYRGTQGSRLIPYSWFRALEQPDSESAFIDPDFLKTFNFLYPEPSNKASKLDLPIGFVIDKQNDDKFITTKLRWKKNQKNDEPWIGMNCSACHTGKIEYNDLTLTLDGAPGLIDFQSFIEKFDEALGQTINDKNKFKRFSEKILNHPIGQEEVAKLENSLKRLLKWQETTARLDESASRYGYGRLDAFGHIFNKTVMFANLDSKKYEESLDNMTGNPSDAPVSFPFLWGIQDQWQVQWNGIVENQVITTNNNSLIKYFTGNREIELGAIGRNTGEVLGVFGEAIIDKKFFSNFDASYTALISNGFKSSVNISSLNGLEAKLKTLQPPKWPNEFPKLDMTKIMKGKKLFGTQGCNNCHTPTAAEIVQGEKKKDCKGSEGKAVPNKKGTECMNSFYPPLNNKAAEAIKIAARASSTDIEVDAALKSYTDILMACNAISYSAKTGRLKGITIDKNKLGDTALVAAMLTTTVKGVIFDNKRNTLNTASEEKVDVIEGKMVTSAGGLPSKIPAKIYHCLRQLNELIESNGCQKSPEQVLTCQLPDKLRALLAYKARPLDGIWATAPYLHNGSVPTLYDLLLPVDDRPTEFWVGSHKFDPKKVGYVSEISEKGRSTKFTTTIDGVFNAGNSNYGHDYDNKAMTDEERWALVEYMKSL